MCTELELREGATIGVWLDGIEAHVSKDRLTAAPTVPQRDNLVAAWKRTVKSWGRDVTDWQEVKITFEQLSDGSHLATLRLKNWDGDEDIFVYQASDDSVTPEEWRVILVRDQAIRM